MSVLNQTILDQTQHCAGSLYHPAHEHDACGVGFVAKVDGTRSNKILRMGLESLCRLVHRGALDADAKARATLDGFSPSARRDYLEWINEAKRDDTRAKRIVTAIEWLREGKKRHWKYENC